jgi:Hemerythrin HHE cation binding domain
MNQLLSRLSPSVTNMIRMDHTHVMATFHQYEADTRPQTKKALVDTASLALEIHAQLEEEIFYPAMRSSMPELVDKSVPEHNEMRRVMSNLRSMNPTDADYDVAFMGLMRTIIHHVADEETMLLPEAERVLGERLEELGWAMTRRRMELAGPRAGEIAVNTMRAYPAVVLSAVALVAVGGYLAWRGAQPRIDRSLGRRVGDALRHPGRFLPSGAGEALRHPSRLLPSAASEALRHPTKLLPRSTTDWVPRRSKRWLTRSAKDLVAHVR